MRGQSDKTGTGPVTQYFHEAHTVRSERLANFRGSYGTGSAGRYTWGHSPWIV